MQKVWARNEEEGEGEWEREVVLMGSHGRGRVRGQRVGGLRVRAAGLLVALTLR